MINIPEKKKTKKNSLGLPPKPTEITEKVLDAPETAPLMEQGTAPKPKRKKTRRTHQMNLKVTPEFDREIRRIMYEQSYKNMGDLFEDMLKSFGR